MAVKNETFEVKFDQSKFKLFVDAHAKAKRKKRSMFKFEGREILVAYASYVIDYLKPKFDKLKKI